MKSSRHKSRNRCVLHLSKLDEFAAWAESEGYKREALAPGSYEVLRLRHGGNPVLIFWRRDRGDHATLGKNEARLVRRWPKRRSAA